MAFTDILYEKRDGIATITINRPNVLNAFRLLRLRCAARFCRFSRRPGMV